jgi:hypothetical protein
LRDGYTGEREMRRLSGVCTRAQVEVAPLVARTQPCCTVLVVQSLSKLSKVLVADQLTHGAFGLDLPAIRLELGILRLERAEPLLQRLVVLLELSVGVANLKCVRHRRGAETCELTTMSSRAELYEL